jgi:hypothetical protein
MGGCDGAMSNGTISRNGNVQWYNLYMELKQEVKSYKIEYTCDECKAGTMKFTGLTLTSNPPQYEHQCTNCGVIIHFRGITYPRIVYESKDSTWIRQGDPDLHAHQTTN